MALRFCSMCLLTTPKHTRPELCMVRMHLLSLKAQCACLQILLRLAPGQVLKPEIIRLCRGIQ